MPGEDPGGGSSAQDVLATEPVIRRVVASRVANSSDIDDIVQDTLERLLGARGRLAPGTILPFGIVTARNLVVTHARNVSRRSTAAPRLADFREPEQPEAVVLANESRRAMTTALARLSPQERRDLVAYYDDSPRSPGTGPATSPGALRVRMSRTRAKLRLEYLLAFRHVVLPSPQCHRVLLAISAADTRRQRELEAGRHLLQCETCAMLSDPLDQRSAALTAITLPAALAAWGLASARAHPVQAAASVAGAAAVAAAAAVGPGLLAAGPGAAAHAHPVTEVSARPAKPGPRPAAPSMVRGLKVSGRPADVRASLRSLIGRPADASGVTVQEVVTRDGFWIGSSAARVWVELTGPLRPLHIRAGEQLQFTGLVVRNTPSYPARVGVNGRHGATLLARQGAHIRVRTTSVRVRPPS